MPSLRLLRMKYTGLADRYFTTPGYKDRKPGGRQVFPRGPKPVPEPLIARCMNPRCRVVFATFSQAARFCCKDCIPVPQPKLTPFARALVATAEDPPRERLEDVIAAASELISQEVTRLTETIEPLT